MILINNDIYDIISFEYNVTFLPKLNTSIIINFNEDVKELSQFLNKNKQQKIIIENKYFSINQVLKWSFYSKEKKQIIFLLEEEN